MYRVVRVWNRGPLRPTLPPHFAGISRGWQHTAGERRKERHLEYKLLMEKGKGRREGIKINEMGALQGEHRFEDWIVQAWLYDIRVLWLHDSRGRKRFYVAVLCNCGWRHQEVNISLVLDAELREFTLIGLRHEGENVKLRFSQRCCWRTHSYQLCREASSLRRF